MIAVKFIIEPRLYRVLVNSAHVNIYTKCIDTSNVGKQMCKGILTGVGAVTITLNDLSNNAARRLYFSVPDGAVNRMLYCIYIVTGKQIGRAHV